MKKIKCFLDSIVFLATTFAIAGVFYEGMKLQWFSLVGILIIFMDYSFFLATLLNLFTEKKRTWFELHLVSLILIIAAISMKILNIPYPTLSLVLWYFYIWFLYGLRIVGHYLEHQQGKTNSV
ncbi:MAG: hypothetical protein E7062_06760 [Spirochaetaceae bacterium]|nr:hypothetical protein [Spirochaetaceae bacterium]